MGPTPRGNGAGPRGGGGPASRRPVSARRLDSHEPESLGPEDGSDGSAGSEGWADEPSDGASEPPEGADEPPEGAEGAPLGGDPDGGRGPNP